jgi:hypothetical protein
MPETPGVVCPMAMARKDRFRLKSQLVSALGTRRVGLSKTNLLLNEFGLESLDGDWHGPSVADLVSPISDAALTEMYAIVMGIEADEVEGVVGSSSDDGNWKAGCVRVFLSHSAVHKGFVGDVANELAVNRHPRFRCARHHGIQQAMAGADRASAAVDASACRPCPP